MTGVQTCALPIYSAAGSEKTRIELRSPDPAANPYLALAVCLRAGLEGIREKTEPGAGYFGKIGRAHV